MFNVFTYCSHAMAKRSSILQKHRRYDNADGQLINVKRSIIHILLIKCRLGLLLA